MKKSQLIFKPDLPSLEAFPTETVLFYDSVLGNNKVFKAWLKGFKYKISLRSGEGLKDLASFHSVLKKINLMHVPQTTEINFVALGGGSVGDFVGFLASVYLRGRKLIHIPTTWLAAVDSAHGGKTALNLFSIKNQIGTFYPAEKIYLIKKVLKNQPTQLLQEAMGEVLKTGIISGSKLFSKIENNAAKMSAEMLFQLLPDLIGCKNRIVKKDPFEKNGERRLLNLGHTIGHVLESRYRLSHGHSVLLGLLFSIRFSYQLKITNEKNYIRISNLIDEVCPEQNLTSLLAGLPKSKWQKMLSKDKKTTSEFEIDFIFIKDIGHVIRKKVSLSDIFAEIQRQIKEY